MILSVVEIIKFSCLSETYTCHVQIKWIMQK